MTCVIGYRDAENDCVYIGADSFGGNDYCINIRKDPKIFHYDNREDIIIGFTSSFRMGQLLMYDKTLFKGIPTQYITHSIMVSKVIPRIIKLYKSNDYDIRDGDGERKGGQFLLGIKNKLWFIDEDFQVASSEYNYWSVGAGSDYALGSLRSTEHLNISIGNKIFIALESSASFSPYVEEPFYVLNTKDKNVMKQERLMV